MEKRDLESLPTQMITGEDHPHPIGIIQIVSPLTTLENEKEMTGEAQMTGKLGGSCSVYKQYTALQMSDENKMGL